MALGDARSTGRRRSQSVNRPDSRAVQGASNTVSMQAATQKNLIVPNIQPKKTGMEGLVDGLKATNKKLQAYQNRNQEKWTSEAEQKSRAIIDRELAGGKSIEQIRQDFSNGAYPELKTQLSYDMFNVTWGNRQAIDYFESPKGEGYQKLQDWKAKFEAAPFHERQEMDIERFLAQQKDNFRNKVGSNPKVLAGAMARIGAHNTKLRKSLNETAETLNNNDITNTGAALLRTTILDAYESNVGEGATNFEIDDEPLTELEFLKEIPFITEQFLVQFADNNGMARSNISNVKLMAVEDLITDVTTSNASGLQKLRTLAVAEEILKSKANDNLPSLLKNNRLYKTNTGGQRAIRDEAQSQLAKLQSIRSGLQEGVMIDQAVGQAEAALTSPSQETSEVLRGQQTDNYLGSGKSRVIILNRAIQNIMVDLKREHGESTPRYYSELTILAERWANNEAIPKFTELKTQVSEAFKNIKTAGEQLRSGEASGPFTKEVMAQVQQAYGLYVAMSQSAKRTALDSYFSREEQGMFAELHSRVKTSDKDNGQVVNLDPDTLASVIPALTTPLPPLTQEQVKLYREDIIDELDGWWFGLLGGRDDLDVGDFSPDTNPGAAQLVRSLIAEAYAVVGRSQGGNIKDKITTHVLKNITALRIDHKTGGFLGTGFRNKFHILIRANPGDPLHHSNPQRKFALKQVQEHLYKIDREGNYGGTLRIRQLNPNKNSVFIITDSIGNAIPAKDGKGALHFEINSDNTLKAYSRGLTMDAK